MSEREIIHDKENHEYVLNLPDGLKASVSYSLYDNHMRLTYSEVPRELRGQGIGKELVEKTFEKLTEEGYEAEAVCGYIRRIAIRSEKWGEIIDV
ncbi:MAG: N-acetyltransferase [Crocinitomicaceae bacterium]|nr:N-acetyltransferase [Crocinitomicaceae bacterium]